MSRDVLNEVKKSVENPLLVDWARRVQDSMRKNKPALNKFFETLRQAMEKSGGTISSTQQALKQQVQQKKMQQEKAAAVNPALAYMANRYLQEMQALQQKNKASHPHHHRFAPEALLTDLERELHDLKPNEALGDHVEEDLKRIKNEGKTPAPNPLVSDKFNFTLDRNKSFNIPTPAPEPMDAKVVNYLETKAIEIAQTVFQKIMVEGPDAGPKKGPTPFNMRLEIPK